MELSNLHDSEIYLFSTLRKNILEFHLDNLTMSKKLCTFSTPIRIVLKITLYIDLAVG